MSEYVVDPSRPSGWKTISYSKKKLTDADGAPVTADGMDEGGDGGSDADEAPDFLLY